jgi:hypothetical protein
MVFSSKKEDMINSFKEIFGSRCHILLIFSILIFIAYSFYIFTVWYFARYFYPIMLQFNFLLLFVIDRLIYRKKKWLMAYSFLIITFITVMNIKSPEFTDLYFSKDNLRVGYMYIGNWVKNNLPPGTRIGAAQSGALSYFADNQQIINLDGCVNKPFYEACLQKKGIEYVKAKKIDFIIDWTCNIEYIKFMSSNYNDKDLTYLKTIDSNRLGVSKWFVYRVNY